MDTSPSEFNNELENQMENMCSYLEKLVAVDLIDASGVGKSNDLSNQIHQSRNKPKHCSNEKTHGISFVSDVQTAYRPPNYSLVGASPEHTPTYVSSVLATAANASTSTPKFTKNIAHCPWLKKLNNFKRLDPDASFIDIDATMIQLGLTPESFVPNDVQKLFSLFSDLEFAINAEFITKSIYDQQIMINNRNVSAHTKFAVWSSRNLLRSLCKVLKKPMPAKLKSEFHKCEHILGDLQRAIANLESFKHYSLEHRKGAFITHESKEHLQALMHSLRHLTECVEQSRKYIQVYERAMNATATERIKPPIIISCEGEGYPKSIPCNVYAEPPSTSRPVVPRRFIG